MRTLIPNVDFKSVIFDLDGTLIDSIPVWHSIDIEYLKKKNLPLNEYILEVAKNMSFMEWATCVVEFYQLEQSAEEIMNEIELMAFEAYQNKIPLKAGVLEYLEYLKQNGIKMAIATAGIKSLAEAICVRFGIDKYMENITYIAEVERSKEHPDIYLLAAKRMEAQPFDCVVFEDLLLACRGAMQGGFRAIGVFDDFSVENHAEMRELTEQEIVTDFRSLIHDNQ